MAFKFINLIILITSFHSSVSWMFNDIGSKSFEDNILRADDELTAEDLAQLRFNLIYPGTKWCGPGNVAEGYDDLGPSKEADACCRDHDNCPEYITPGETKFNLTNGSFYTRFSCNCDKSLRRCLLKANTDTANALGILYFNVIGTMCYRNDYAITGCKKKGGWLNTKCIEYSYNTSSEKFYQWFDVPSYRSARLHESKSRIKI